MAKLIIKTVGLEAQVFELKLGSNRIGRSLESDFQIPHPTVSSLHCELILSDSGVLLHDLASTNGTFVEGEPITEALLSPGQTVRLGDVELLVETTDATVAIPKFVDPELPAPPVVIKDAGVICPRHPHSFVTHQCSNCKEVMCEQCVHRMKRKGSKTLLLLCPICSNAVERIGQPKSIKKKSLLERVSQKVKLKLTRPIRRH